ncbi:MAG TPA: diacylglycerol kinase family protein [Thermoleophilaceae bacterium]|nr:diacylglycerol kinase family protein [Thermoleophilaceae bacterium]
MARRLAAAAALVLTLATVVLAITVAVNNFPRGITVLACVVVALLAAWWGIAHHGAARGIGLGLAVLLLLGAVALIVFEGKALQDLLVLVLAVLALEMARRAFLSRADLPAAPRPERAVLFYNPKSGGGKATRFHLADEARKRGIEAVELKLGEDLRELVRRAIADGADALAMAGGDGSQAIVADEAAAHGLPYACIPSGTRNHFALDLGVDRDDVVGALDALVDGRERVVDLAEVNGRVFVNNVSLGVYAEAVQRQGYREAKLRTIADTAPEVLGPGAGGLDLRWAGPDGRENRSGAVLLVSNDPYRMGHALASGTRPRLDMGMLGIAVMGVNDGARNLQWSSDTFQVDSGGNVAAGIDGEAASLEPPLVFRSRPGVLRVRIAPHHPGASPSARIPEGPLGAVRGLVRIVFGHATD